jgi:hypothetical protein
MMLSSARKKKIKTKTDKKTTDAIIFRLDTWDLRERVIDLIDLFMSLQ